MMGKPSELLQAPDMKEETVDIGIPGLQSQSSDCRQWLWVLVEQRGWRGGDANCLSQDYSRRKQKST